MFIKAAATDPGLIDAEEDDGCLVATKHHHRTVAARVPTSDDAVAAACHQQVVGWTEVNHRHSLPPSSIRPTPVDIVYTGLEAVKWRS